MQPSPIAETRGPADPSCRVITGNLLHTLEFPANLATDLNVTFWPQATGRFL